jgi:hypothetical protein
MKAGVAVITVTPVMVAVCELLPKVAVSVAVWPLVNVAPAVALKVAVAAPAATVTDDGTVSKVLLLFNVTLTPPAGAAAFNVTVHLLTPLGLRLVGLQVSAETTGGATRAIMKPCELLPRVAVTVGV